MRNKKSNVQVFASFKSKTNKDCKIIINDDPYLYSQNTKWEDPNKDLVDFINDMEKWIKESTPYQTNKFLKTPHGLVPM